MECTPKNGQIDNEVHLSQRESEVHYEATISMRIQGICFATTVGYNDLNATIAYTENQEAHHGVAFA